MWDAKCAFPASSPEDAGLSDRAQIQSGVCASMRKSSKSLASPKAAAVVFASESSDVMRIGFGVFGCFFLVYKTTHTECFRRVLKRGVWLVLRILKASKPSVTRSR